MNTTASHQYQQVAHAIEYLYQHFRDQPSLEEVASQVNMSAFHFQRTFTEWAGISPKRFLQFLTTDYLKQRITGFDNLLDAADAAGLSGQSRVYDLFVNLEAVTPQEYKAKGTGITIDYGFHPSPFGDCIIGVTERGVCFLSFMTDNNRHDGILELEKEWENASIRHNERNTKKMAELIFNRTPVTPNEKLSVLVKGTNFQVKVWNALLQIPMGAVSTYQALAGTVGQPEDLQAVNTAVATNHLAYLIPCHRIIKKNLIIGDYHWGAERKKAILGWEMAKTEENQNP